MINTTEITKQQLKNGVASNDERLSMQGVYLDAKNQKLVVTNGFILVMYPIEDCENDESAIIPVGAFDINFVSKQLGIKKKDLNLNPLNYKVTEKQTIVTHPSVSDEVKFNNIQEKYPDYENVVPDWGLESNFNGTIAFGRDMMRKLMESLPKDYDFIHTKFYDDGHAIKFKAVRSYYEWCDFIEGLIMPNKKYEEFDEEIIELEKQKMESEDAK